MLTRRSSFCVLWLALLALTAMRPAAPPTPSGILFIENVGQFPAHVRFLLYGTPHLAWFTDDALWVAIPDGPQTHYVEIAFGDDARPTPFDRATTRISYLAGADASGWREGVPVWQGIRWTNVAPDVDVVFGGREDVHVRASALPSLARIAPCRVVYQATLVPPTVCFTGSAQGLERLSAAPPILSGARDLIASTWLGGSGWEEAHAIAVDGAGDAYLAGWTASADFPTTPGTVDRTLDGERDAFVAKVSGDGRRLIYAMFLGGSGRDEASGLAVDEAGRAYVAGYTASADFPVTAGAFAATYRGGPSDAFVARLDASGARLDWATFLGGSGEDVADGLAWDPLGMLHVVGRTESSDWPTTAGAADRALDGNWDGFLARLDGEGRALVYSTFLGGMLDERCVAVAADGAGHSYLTGYTVSPDFPITPGAFDVTYGAGNGDGFVAKISAPGALAYATFLGGSSEDRPQAVAVGDGGAAYITGYTRSDDFPTTPGALDPDYNAFQDAFVVKLASSGERLGYATFLGGRANDVAYGIAANAAGEAHVVGSTRSTEFPTTPGAFDTSYNGRYTYQEDAFLVRLRADGSALHYGTFLGGTQVDDGYAVALGDDGTAYLAGYTGASDWPLTEGAADATLAQGEAFFARLDTVGDATPSPTMSGTPTASATLAATRTPTTTRTPAMGGVHLPAILKQ